MVIFWKKELVFILVAKLQDDSNCYQSWPVPNKLFLNLQFEGFIERE